MRKIPWFGLALCLFIAAAACSGPGGDLRGATPAGYLRPVANPITAETADTVTIAELVENPEEYEGQVIEVSGDYYQRPVVVCSSRPQFSPARWALSDGEERIPAAGMDQHLNNLPSGRIEVTVTGRLLRWQGPIGCGRQAQVTEVWYLDVIELLSPNPITIAAVGTAGEGVSIELEPPEQTSETGEPTGGYPGPEDETGEAQVTAAATLTDTTSPELPGPVGTPVLQPPTPTLPAGGETNPAATPTIFSPGSPITPTVTSAAATPSPTTTGGSPAPTATSGGGSGSETTQEDLPPGSIETAQLGAAEIHRWPFVITSTAVITVNIASEIALDAGIAIRSPSGNIIAEQNNVQDGAPEILAAVTLTELGTYDILITSENETPGYYAILVVEDESYTFVFNGTIELEQSETADMRADNDHFWHFFGSAGDVVTIRVTPDASSDLFIRIFGPDGTLLVDFHNETDAGEAEELLSFTLPDTGFYSILIGELNFGAASYSISLSNG